jgi:transcription elongation factor GreA
MRVPIRKPGKYTHQKPDFYITEGKFSEFKNDLVKLKKIQPGAAKEVKRLAELGDLSENAAYQIAKGRLRSINQRIHDLDNYINKAIIIKPAKDNNVVGLGNKVTVEIKGEEKIFLILGSSEADPQKGIISQNSPIGSALIGRQVGDEVKIKARDKFIECKIIRIQ